LERKQKKINKMIIRKEKTKQTPNKEPSRKKNRETKKQEFGKGTEKINKMIIRKGKTKTDTK
jgi:hypothetical protein